MKRWIALLLAAVMCFCTTACGTPNANNNGGTQQGAGSNKDDTAKHNIHIKEGENGLTYIVFPNSKVFSEYVVKVEITKDNWHEYFEDYEYTEHIVRTNAFGDIEEEYDAVHIGFGLKRNLLGLTDTVSFKFDGITDYNWSGFNQKDADKVEYEVYKANQATYGVYSYTKNELIGEEPLDDDEIKEWYLLEIKYDDEEEEITQINETTFTIDGTIDLDEVNELVGVDLPDDKIDAVVGEELIHGECADSRMCGGHFAGTVHVQVRDGGEGHRVQHREGFKVGGADVSAADHANAQCFV